MPYMCLLQEGISNLPRLLEKAQHNSFNVVAVPINFADIPIRFEEESICNESKNFTYPDLLLKADQWSGKVILLLSDSVDCDSLDANVRRESEMILERDIAWAEHLQYSGYTMIRLKSGKNMNLARIVTGSVKGIVLVRVPLYNAKLAQCVWRRDIDETQLEHISQEEDPWHWWNRFRLTADYNPKVKVVLEFNEGNRPTIEEVRRWLGEPVEAVLIPSTLFITNRFHYPVLLKEWQDIIAHFLRAHVNVIVSTGIDDNKLKMYYDYLHNLMETHSGAHQLKSFEDVLEIPLQPLYDNLDCYTYEVFEKDPVKYKKYQDAITAALIDRVSEDEKNSKLTIIMVLGAGRGPLVRASLNAGENTKRKVRVYIIEKNPNAIRTLRCIAKKLWYKKDVHIFSQDMREFTPPEKADILVSELLGSFGDNELSPECLDCAQKLLKTDGISIPCKSTSYINPVMSAKLFNAVNNLPRHDAYSRGKQSTVQTFSECGYVVLLKNIFNIAFPQALFDFVHPNWAEKIDNSRYKILHFEASMDCIFHGIAGYFDTILYKDITLSINPLTHTPGMPSWFPMYFPISDPMHIKKGQTIEIHFWRCVSKRQVWYEWSVGAPFTTHIHNHRGRAWPMYCA